MSYILAFVGMAAMDWVYAKYVLALEDRRPVVAGNYSIALFLLTSLVTLTYVADVYSVIPGAAGAFIGTYLGIRK